MAQPNEELVFHLEINRLMFQILTITMEESSESSESNM
jgi:hypothetical protein